MEKIIQLKEYEYNKLAELAKLNEKQMEDKALALWKDKGVAEIKIIVKSGNNYDGEYHIDCESYVWHKNDKFFIPERIRERFARIVENDVMFEIERKFGNPVKMINIFNKKAESLNRLRYIAWGIAASGWAVATVCLLLK